MFQCDNQKPPSYIHHGHRDDSAATIEGRGRRDNTIMNEMYTTTAVVEIYVEFTTRVNMNIYGCDCANTIPIPYKCYII